MTIRRTKIIATVGPASDSAEMLDALIAAGTDIFRLNFSHGTHDSQAAAFARIRAAAGRAGREVAILQDLAGPKIRTGLLAGHTPFRVKTGDTLRIATGDFVGEPGRVSTTFAGLAKSVRPGDRLLLADGLLELRVVATDGNEIETTVVDGGEIGEHKGINAPGVPLPTSAITKKDIEDLKFGLSLGVDMVAVSFVQTAADLRRARHVMIDANAGDVPLMAKLERPQALDVLDEILAACDAVMVARGDLGLEMPLERVPRAQKDITRAARRRGVPVVVATQVLESMIVEARPTRAEVNDAANAVDDGVDAIMLAGETAAGAHPAKAVQTLDAIIRDAESTVIRLQSSGESLVDIPPRTVRAAPLSGADDHQDALCEAAVTLAENGHAKAIVAVTQAGHTARRLSAKRPCAPVVAITSSPITARRIAIYWGVVPLLLDIADDVDGSGPLIRHELLTRGLCPAGGTVVLVRIHDDISRTDANYLKIRRL
jgi:pyruvate kinase